MQQIRFGDTPLTFSEMLSGGNGDRPVLPVFFIRTLKNPFCKISDCSCQLGKVKAQALIELAEWGQTRIRLVSELFRVIRSNSLYKPILPRASVNQQTTLPRLLANRQIYLLTSARRYNSGLDLTPTKVNEGKQSCSSAACQQAKLPFPGFGMMVAGYILGFIITLAEQPSESCLRLIGTGCQEE